MHVVATAGHVDHGKSTLVRALTGMEPDRWAEERRRGLTIDLGFAWTDIAGEQVAFVDVPGHHRFVHNMLAGVGPVPAVLFVVAADEGWMPQSAEHLAVLDALDVTHGVLAITRADLADPSAVAASTSAAAAAIAATSLGATPAIAVSAATGAGVPQLREALAELTTKLPRPDDCAPVRLWVDRSFSVKGAGTVVTGTLTAGCIRLGDELLLMPAGRTVKVRGLQTTGADRDRVCGVSRVAVNLRAVEPDDVRRGDSLVTPDAFTVTTEIDVRLRRDSGPADARAHAVADEMPTHAVMHIGSAALPARIRPLGAPEKNLARLTFPQALPLHVLDRGLLRDPGLHRVVAGITVLDVRPPALARRGAAAARAGEFAAAGEFVDADAEIRRRCVVRHRDLVAMGYRPQQAETAPGWHVSAAELGRLAARLRDELARWRTEHPLEQGIPVEAARQRLALPDAALVDGVRRAARLEVADGRITSSEAAWLPAAVLRAVDALLADLDRDPFAAPDADRLRALGLGPAEIAAAARAGLLTRVDAAIVLAPGADRRAAHILATLPQPFRLSDARQALSTSRRVAVPLMELLDRRGLTRRLPDDTRCVVDIAPDGEATSDA